MPNRRMTRWLPAALTLAAVLAPAVAQGQKEKAAKKERDLIAREELVEADEKFSDLFTAISRLRSHFLSRNRGPRTMGITPGAQGAPMCNEVRERNCAARNVESTVVPPVVYVDGVKSGDPEILRGFRTRDVQEVRYMNANQASSEYGIGHEGGAILVKLYHP